MIKHIVIFKLKEEAEGNSRDENKMLFQGMLHALVGVVPSLKSMEVGVKGEKSPADNSDIVLITEFASWEDLDAYQVHPEHQKVVAFAKKVVEARSVVDYEF